jgi:predicted xylose isomerase-like sugar epimerase
MTRVVTELGEGVVLTWGKYVLRNIVRVTAYAREYGYYVEVVFSVRNEEGSVVLENQSLGKVKAQTLREALRHLKDMLEKRGFEARVFEYV